MTDAELAELERLCDAADGCIYGDAYTEIGSSDSIFLEAAKDAVPALIAEVRRMRHALYEITYQADQHGDGLSVPWVRAVAREGLGLSACEAGPVETDKPTVMPDTGKPWWERGK